MSPSLLTPRRLRILAWIAGLVGLFGILGFLVLPPLLKAELQKELSARLHREVSIAAVSVNPYTLTLTISGFAIKERGGKEDFLAFDELYANAELSSVLRLAPVLKEFRLSAPRLKLVHIEAGRYNVSDLISEFMAKPGDGPTPRFSLNNIQIVKGRIDFDDKPAGAKHEITDIGLGIPFISSIPSLTDIFVEPKLSARVDGAPLEIGGKTKPFRSSRETAVTIDIDKFELSRLSEYLPADIKLKVPSGRLDSKLVVKFLRHPDKPATLTVSGSANLANLVVTESGGKPLLKLPRLDIALAELEPLAGRARLDAMLQDLSLTGASVDEQLLSVPKLEFKGAALDYGKREIAIDEIASSGAKLALTRDKNGQLLLPKLPGLPQPAAEEKPGPEWTVTLAKLAIEGYSIALKDASTRRGNTLSIDPISLTAQDLSTRKDAKGKIELNAVLNKKGSLTIAGALALQPLSGDMSIDAKGMAILPFQPYFASKLNINVTSGDVALKGAMNWKLGAPGQAPVSGNFSGMLAVTRFASVERRSAEDFLKWKSLHIGAFRGALDPLSVEIDEIALTDFYSRLIVLPDGRLNVQDIVRKARDEATPRGEAGAAGAAVAAPVPPAPTTTTTKGATTTTTVVTPSPAPDTPANSYLTKIGRITLQGGNINFSDHFIKPNYSANLTGVGGSITRISPETPADLDLRGTVDNSAPLLIAGKINPLAKDLFIDIKGSVKGFDMSPMTPYSGRYIGYAIQKGKLSMDVTYKLENRQLTATNKLLLTQLTLGDKIEHPDAIKLPVTLALALLKDRNGNIDLELPISGSLDDPQFSVGAIVVKVIVNLIVKAVTAPFALLGALFSGGSGGEELSWIEFDYGYAALSAAATTKLNNLVKALDDRPGLTLDIAGRVDPGEDKEGLRHAMLEHKVKTQKFRALSRAGTPAASLAEVTLEPAEYAQYLERAYDAEKFAKPRNVIGLAKLLPKEEMEKLILANTTVNDEDLHELAEQRAKAVQQALLKAGISAERVFLLASRIDAPEAKDKAKMSRADLSLR